MYIHIFILYIFKNRSFNFINELKPIRPAQAYAGQTVLPASKDLNLDTALCRVTSPNIFGTENNR